MVYAFKKVKSDIRDKGPHLEKNGSNITATVDMAAEHKNMAQTHVCVIYTCKWPWGGVKS